LAYRVPFVDPRTHYQRYRSEIDSAIAECLMNGDLIYRDQLRRFEENLAAFVGVRHAVGVNSGYHALHFALLGAGVGPGDEVITVAHTFVATISAIVHCGATPILVDVGTDYNIDPVCIERAITSRTRAIVCVHLNGRVCAMDQILALAERYHLAIIEDAAQSLGATYGGKRTGGFGLAGCFSFYPFKILGGFGDGGALTTNDQALANMASLLRYNGEDRQTGELHYHGYTALLDNVQAAVLDRKLSYLPSWIEHRRRVAERYWRGLDGLTGLILPHYDETRQQDVFQNYVVRTVQRDRLREYLRQLGIETLVHWPKPLWDHPALGLKALALDETMRICREVLSLPISAETTDEHVDITVEAIREFFA